MINDTQKIKDEIIKIQDTILRYNESSFSFNMEYKTALEDILNGMYKI